MLKQPSGAGISGCVAELQLAAGPVAAVCAACVLTVQCALQVSVMRQELTDPHTVLGGFVPSIEGEHQAGQQSKHNTGCGVPRVWH